MAQPTFGKAGGGPIITAGRTPPPAPSPSKTPSSQLASPASANTYAYAYAYAADNPANYIDPTGMWSCLVA